MNALRRTADHGPAGLTKFHRLLLEQVGHEFTASHQYFALAAWFDDRDLPAWPGCSTASRWRSATTPP